VIQQQPLLGEQAPDESVASAAGVRQGFGCGMAADVVGDPVDVSPRDRLAAADGTLDETAPAGESGRGGRQACGFRWYGPCSGRAGSLWPI
jgi:hypothetical protein